ncbi:MFS transporter [Stackebrandtia nassauensis]|uniref:Major facilitator superfamily MFS_1 n=1 Tax=Stackebrandtia nassauensis (strain DSM 44728 / CIP 108903 / NRRL B-16338 / NBRC 102104 / LLR-40K-21) TaxID=446470 RepID=D3Q7L6_STANL|nr:MFS transporter [Stackebrandtia nassauensis]ADD44358.1 major facilitator superfamily MFS_1 [Stackebrandtia nassauensis DSM 44728]
MTVSKFRELDATVRLLCLNQFGINAGFFMLMPFLAAYLSGGIGLVAGLVGLLLGVRNFSQQGLFFAGGALADRFGYKPMILAGCALRTVGFGVLGFTDSLPGLVLGMVATGAAGALFNPAVRAYIAAQAGDKRVEAFAVFNVFYQAGILAGPLIGLALSGVDFSVTCFTAAAIFAALTLAQARLLPKRHGENSDRPSMVDSWRTVARNRGFLLFSVVMAATYVLNFQTYLALPLLLNQHTTPAAASLTTTVVFAIAGILTITAQVRVTAWCKNRWGPSGSLCLGVIVMGAAFLPVAAVLAWRPDAGVVIAAVVVCGTILATGTMITYPFEMDTIVTLAREQHVASHYGVFQTVAGIAVAAGNLAVGAGLDATGVGPWSTLPWAGLALAGFGCALGLRAIAIRGATSVAQPVNA